MLCAGVEEAPPAGNLVSCLGHFYMEFFFGGGAETISKQTLSLFCSHDMFTLLMISVFSKHRLQINQVASSHSYVQISVKFCSQGPTQSTFLVAAVEMMRETGE